jgi:CheY-like chemotaxis protein
MADDPELGHATDTRVFPRESRAFPLYLDCGALATFMTVVHLAEFFRPPVLLVGNVAGTWLSHALTSLLKSRGYRIQSASSGSELLERAPALRPDIVVLDTDLPDLDAAAVCGTLRRDRAAWNMPIIMVTSTPATKEQRLTALKAGAWDYLSVLASPEELTLKLDAMARLKLETDRALAESVVDPTSGLYTRRGLERRARELTAEAFRRHAPLACVALGIEADPRGTPAAVAYAASVLQVRGRTSDAIGSFGQGALAVLAPATAPPDALKMAQRLSQVLETAGPLPAGVPALRVLAGYDAAADVHETPIDAGSLLEHAGTALDHARAAKSGERIRAYGA